MDLFINWLQEILVGGFVLFGQRKAVSQFPVSVLSKVNKLLAVALYFLHIHESFIPYLFPAAVMTLCAKSKTSIQFILCTVCLGVH